MNNSDSEPTQPNLSENLEIAAAAIDAHLINQIQEREELFTGLENDLSPEVVETLKQLWLSDIRLAFFSGTLAQSTDPSLTILIQNIIANNPE